MLISKDPGLRKLEKFLDSNSLEHSTILHWTGSMWGIGCRLSSLETIARIETLKQRAEKQGFIALIPDINYLDQKQIPAALRPLMHQYWPGNLTFIFPYQDSKFETITNKGKVAFRVPSDPALRAFISLLGEPLISTSVNVSGLMPEENYDRIISKYGSWFDFALLPANKEIKSTTEPSTIIEYISAADSGNNDEIKCLREGSIPFYEIKQAFKLPVVMFVCTANICRSPMAEYLFRKMARENNISLATDSCGLLPGGQMISVNALQLLLERGILDAQQHISQQITPQLVSSSWLILTMEERQRDLLRTTYPNSESRIMTLNEIVGEKGDIEDPFGRNLESYRKTCEIIENRLQLLTEYLKNNELNIQKKII
ncbi:MAG: Sua5/YciO/YrdC/YwlC family protein [Candidatus Cloacimonetes bacterium]|nr:Sua5/YciO/YrdC/YwlC family protein [Candidatus Cloacimonadota bacterium]HNV92976.1 Sua5/YciO/YrdC/YwlC family protein [Candidatus Cloacimonas sp.]